MTNRDLPSWAADILASLPPLLEREHAARVLNVSTKTIDRRISLKQIIGVKTGGRVVVPRRSLVDHLVASAR